MSPKGFEPESPSAFVNFPYYAKGSCGELRTQLYIAGRLGYIGRSQVKELIAAVKSVSRMIAGVIRYLKKKRQEDEG
ncbi:MAG TPA: four helix bundle protein [Planctomycetota bacterium]|nr:four helix bundle protein [Planctomycetota bacterium]